MVWHCNTLVVERILCYLDFSDLKSASKVCKTWLTASVKAFEEISRLVIPDLRPDKAPDFSNFLQRFQRIKDFKFKLSGRTAAPDGPKSILADLPLEASSTMTRLTLDYEPTAEVLESINSFLCQLTSRFPALQELQICPNADPPEGVESPSTDLVSSAEHSSLTVLRVPVGPNWGSGIDWSFLPCLKKLQRLDLLKLHVRGEGRYVHRQLKEFSKHFPAEAKISQLNLHLRLGLRKTFLRRTNVNALKSAFRAIKPQVCTLYIEQVDPDDRLPPGVHVQHCRSVASEVSASPNLQRINIHYSMPLTSFTNADDIEDHAFGLVAPLRHLRRPEHNAHVLLRVDICSQHGSSPITFFELECAQFRAPLIFRHGPIGDYAQHFQNLCGTALRRWTVNDQDWPVPNYNALRKYTFDESQGMVEETQFYPAERSMADIVVPFRGIPVEVLRFDSPGFRIWRETEYLRFPHSDNLINAQPSWKSTKAEHTLPVCQLSIYSID